MDAAELERADGLRERLMAEVRRVRAATEALAAPLSAEDQGLQSMPSCSPTRWHRAHTTWFFETFVLAPHGVGPVDPRWGVLFNSYYVAVGPRHARPRRGMLSRPGADEITAYRRTVDGRLVELLGRLEPAALAAVAPVIELGLAHEQQHQELLLTDIVHALAENPLKPAYRQARGGGAAAQTGSAAAMGSGAATRGGAGPLRFVGFDGGVHAMGAETGGGFRFDNEEPRHRVLLAPFALADRLVTVGEWKAFADDGGYRRAELWLSDGLDWVMANGVEAPLYARREGGALVVYGPDGEREAADEEPVTNVSFYEADALARFLGGRLPTEAEWERAASQPGVVATDGNFVDDGALRPLPAPASRSPGPGDGAAGDARRLRQLFGDAWEWTASAYAPYPGYRPAAGALGEYNGKFMVNQLVLRGGSSFTPRGHVRPTYRNFWPADTRFQVTGVRVARDGGD